MTPDELVEQFQAGFKKRKFSAGLLVAFIDFIHDLGVKGGGFKNLEAFLEAFPKQDSTGAGGRANTLIVRLRDGSTRSLRPYYNNIETHFRADQKRFDYPSCAPHATQAWTGYVNWWDALISFSDKQRAAVKDAVIAYVLAELPSQEFDPSTVKVDPPLFRILLEDFDVTAQAGEPTGAAYQGIAFGFVRADNPHLQVEIEKVRTGAKRLQRVGDVDCWEGSRLAISAEVKQYILKAEHLHHLEGFANATGKRGAIGLVVALGFDDGVRDAISDLGLAPLDRHDLLRTVSIWDSLKQRTAVASLVYYANHVEKNSTLAARLDEFLTEAEMAWAAPDPEPEPT